MTVHVLKDPNSVTEAVAEWITRLIEKTLPEKEKFYLLLSGGNTPKNLYQLLAKDPYKQRIDWRKLEIFFGDERAVPFTDERNNGRMAVDALLGKVPIPEHQVHMMDTSIHPEAAAKDYEQMLRRFFDTDNITFDLALLGMGDDGHTLSLFPGMAGITESKHWVISVFVPSQQMFRITLTTEPVNRSACIAFLVTGATKAPVLKEVLNETAAPHSYPVQLIKPRSGELHWFVDEAAISKHKAST